MKTNSFTCFLLSGRVFLLVPMFVAWSAKAQPGCNANFVAIPDSATNDVQFMSNFMNPFATYAWDFGDGSTDTLPMTSHTYAASGTYYVCLTVTRYDNAGNLLCTDTHCDSVYAMTTPPPPPPPPAPTCSAQFYTFPNANTGSIRFAGVPNPGGEPVYVWDFGDGSSQDTGKVVHHTYSAAGSYNACLTVSLYDTLGNLLCTDNWCDSVTVAAPPSSSPVCVARFRYFNLRGDSVLRFMAGPVKEYASYSWDFGDGSTDTLKNPTHVYSTSGAYNVCLTITRTDSLGVVLCTDTWCDSVTTGVRHIPGGWNQVYGGGIGSSNAVVMQGAEEEVELDSHERSLTVNAGHVEIYPNPMTENARIRFEQFNGPVTFRVMDHTGRLVLERSNLLMGEITLEKGNWIPGVYFYQVSDAGQQMSGKLIVR